MVRKIYLLLGALFVFSLLVRTVNLGNLPNGFEKDEAYLGYNAYSILKTGRDISGNLFPLHLSSFLYTPAGYSYFSIPLIEVFGLNEFSVRFASALFGSLSVVLVFLLMYSLLRYYKDSPLIPQKHTIVVSFLASILFSIMPWHINLSRTASVITLVVFFVLLGTYFMFRWAEKKTLKYLVFAFASFFLTLFFYIASYTFVPLLILLIVLVLKNNLKREDIKKFLVFYIVFLIPILITFFSPTLSTRIHSLSLINHPEIRLVLTDDISRDGVFRSQYLETRAFHNKGIMLGQVFLKNYFKHLSFEFLFTDQIFPMRYKVPQQGILYLVFVPFLVLGSVFLISKKHSISLLIFGWILLSPVGSSFASDDIPNIQRTLFMLPPLVFLISVGMYYFYRLIDKFGMIGKIALGLTALAFAFNVYYFIHSYTVHLPSFRTWYRQEGYREMIEVVNKEALLFKKAVITNREATPTIFLLFYNTYDPTLAQEFISKSPLKDTDRLSFSKYEITEEECPAQTKKSKNGKIGLTGERNILYVNSGLCKIEQIEKDVRIHKTIKRSDGSIVFYVLSLK